MGLNESCSSLWRVELSEGNGRIEIIAAEKLANIRQHLHIAMDPYCKKKQKNNGVKLILRMWALMSSFHTIQLPMLGLDMILKCLKGVAAIPLPRRGSNRTFEVRDVLLRLSVSSTTRS